MTRATATRIDPRQLPLFDLWPLRDAEASLLGRLGIRNPIVVHAINHGDFDYLAMTFRELDSPIVVGPPPKCDQWVRGHQEDGVTERGRHFLVVSEYQCGKPMLFRYINLNPDGPPRFKAAWCCFQHNGADPSFHGHYEIIAVRPKLQTAPDFDLFAEIKRAIDGAATDLHYEADGWHLRHEEIASVR